MKLFSLLLVVFFTIPLPSNALDIENDAVFIRVIDVGAGLATVVRMPGDYYMVYDAGHWSGEGSKTFQGISEVIPDEEEIDLLVLSHSDADHQGAVKKILDQYTVKKILRGGLERLGSNTWVRANEAISKEVSSEGALDINLRHAEFPPGATYRLGDTFITMVSGFYAPPEDWGIDGGAEGSEFRNAGSIVMRLEFKGKAIIFGGDAVGRHIDSPDDALIASEKFMVENSSVIKIDSDVLIAPHHGADNASSNAFIQAVSPEWVVFAAGHKHGHPGVAAINRYLSNGVKQENLFRTDLGDDESQEWGNKEWDHGRVSGQSDPSGDDDVDILIRPTGEVLIEYRNM